MNPNAALLCSCIIHTGARTKADKTVKIDNDATAVLSRRIYPSSALVRAVDTEANRIRAYVERASFPWAKGVRVIDVTKFFPFNDGLRALVDNFDHAVHHAYSHYDQVVADTQAYYAQCGLDFAVYNNLPTANEFKDAHFVELAFRQVSNTHTDFRIDDPVNIALQQSLQRDVATAQQYWGTQLRRTLHAMQTADVTPRAVVRSAEQAVEQLEALRVLWRDGLPKLKQISYDGLVHELRHLIQDYQPHLDRPEYVGRASDSLTPAIERIITHSRAIY